MAVTDGGLLKFSRSKLWATGLTMLSASAYLPFVYSHALGEWGLLREDPAALYPLMNYANALAAALTTLPFFAVVRRYWGLTAGDCACLALIAVPVGWNLALYGHPMVFAVLFFLLSLVAAGRREAQVSAWALLALLAFFGVKEAVLPGDGGLGGTLVSVSQWLPNPAPGRHFVYAAPVLAAGVALAVSGLLRGSAGHGPRRKPYLVIADPLPVQVEILLHSPTVLLQKTPGDGLGIDAKVPSVETERNTFHLLDFEDGLPRRALAAKGDFSGYAVIVDGAGQGYE